MYPPSMLRLEIDRKLASDNASVTTANDKADMWGRDTLFMQAYSQVVDENDESLRQSYVGKLGA